jgi:hypothetical protein
MQSFQVMTHDRQAGTTSSPLTADNVMVAGCLWRHIHHTLLACTDRVDYLTGIELRVAYAAQRTIHLAAAEGRAAAVASALVARPAACLPVPATGLMPILALHRVSLHGGVAVYAYCGARSVWVCAAARPRRHSTPFLAECGRCNSLARVTRGCCCSLVMLLGHCYPRQGLPGCIWLDAMGFCVCPFLDGYARESTKRLVGHESWPCSCAQHSAR